jgi:RsiW-degrading membrane proteinase PrsW (M82 family)
VVFLVIIYKRDTEKEPPGLLIKCFFLGCIATVPIVIIELIIGSFNTFDSAFLRSFYVAFIVAALVEEGIKFLFLYRIVWKRQEFDQYFDGIVYAVFVSLGFALVENILYVLQGGLSVAVLRAVLSVPGHGLFGVVMGYFFAFAKFSPNKKRRFLFLSLFVPVVFHGLYDFFLMYLGETESGLLAGLLFLGFVVIMILLWRFGARYIRSHRGADIYYTKQDRKT